MIHMKKVCSFLNSLKMSGLIDLNSKNVLFLGCFWKSKIVFLAVLLAWAFANHSLPSGGYYIETSRLMWTAN